MVDSHAASSQGLKALKASLLAKKQQLIEVRGPFPSSMQTWWGTLKILVHDKMVIMRLLVIDDALGGGGACRVVGEGGECVQPACRGRGGRGRRGGLLLQLAHPEGAPAPGDGACAVVGTNMPGAENLGLLL